jgi:hypothetical protein
MAGENLTWNQEEPTVRKWLATDDISGTAYEFTLTKTGTALQAELKINGAQRGNIGFENLEQVADLFQAVATDLRALGY